MENKTKNAKKLKIFSKETLMKQKRSKQRAKQIKMSIYSAKFLDNMLFFLFREDMIYPGTIYIN